MAGMKGMNPVTVESLANELDAASAAVTAAADSALSEFEALEWSGDDREAFRSEMTALHQKGAAIATSLKHLGETARQNAVEQRQASAAA